MEQYPSDNFIPQREPNEVTLEYVAEPKPYVAYYVQDRPLPGRKPETAAQEPPAKTRRKGHRGLKIFLICLAAVLVLAGGLYAAWWFGLLPDRFYGGDHGDYYDNPDYYYYYGELDESAEPELPVVSADDGVRLVYADGHGDALTIQEIYRKVNPSTVTVVTELPRGASVGTGVILTEDGYVVTNYHVVQNASNITVTTHSGDEYAATVKGYDATNDVAVLKVEAEGLSAATIGSSGNLSIGDMVVAIGNPLGRLAATETVGYVSGINREVTTDNTVISMLQTDAAINPGNSGGPLFNMYGEVIGITTAKYSGTTNSGASIEGIGFAIPIDDVMGIISDLIDYGYVTGAYMGITVKDNDKEAAAQFGLPTDGAYVVDVTPGSSADKAGIQSKDLITAVDDHKITTRTDLTRTLRNYKAGDTAQVTVVRSGRELTLTITFDEKPHSTTVETAPQEDSSMPSEGDYNDWYEYFRRFFGG